MVQEQKPNYKNFTYVVVDFKENIDMRDMYDKLIEEMESKKVYIIKEVIFGLVSL